MYRVVGTMNGTEVNTSSSIVCALHTYTEFACLYIPMHLGSYIILVGECSAFLASGSDPTDERCMKHGPQTTPRRGRRELAACVVA